jgi:hypothetical protein
VALFPLLQERRDVGPDAPVRPQIAAGARHKIYAEFLVNGRNVIIESRLPLRDLP